MKSVIILFALLASYCYGEHLLGGWSVSNDESLNEECLKKALVDIQGANGVNNDVRSEISQHECQTQIVNGLNIKCSFVLRGQKWQCSYYKSFMGTREIQLEQCKLVEKGDEQAPPSTKAAKKQESSALDEDDADEEVVLRASPLGVNDEDDEVNVDAISQQNPNNEQEEQ